MVVGGFALAVLITGGCSLCFAGIAWRKRSQPGARALVLYNSVIAIALFAYAFDIISTTRSTQILFLTIWMPMQALTAVTWAYTAIEYTGLERWTGWRTIGLLWLEPAAFTAVLVVPRTREMLFDLPASGVQGSIFLVGAQPRALLSVHYLYTVLVMLVGTLLYLRLFVRSKHLYRTQATAVAVAAAAPWVVLLLQALEFAPTEDPSSIMFAVSGIALTVGLYRFKTLDPVPAARKTIVEQMGDGAIVLDEDDVVSSVNPAARTMLAPEADPVDLVGARIDDLIADWSALDARADGGPTRWQELSLTTDGDDRYAEVQVSPFCDRFDQLVGRLVVLRDVTDRTRREQALVRYKTIFESVSDRVYVLDAANRFVLVNEPFASFVGRSPEELEGQPFESVLAAAAAVSEPPPKGDTVELTIETAGGEAIPCESRRAPISFESLEAGSVGILRDISERKALQSSLQRTTERLETVVEASPLAIIATNLAGRVEVWNDAATEMFGWTAKQVRGELPPVVSSEEEQRLRELFKRVVDGERITGEVMQLDRADGSVMDGSISLAPVTDDSGTIQGSVGVVADITAQKERERRLQRQNERLDEFASLLSHDLRSPLEVASSRLELLAAEADLADETWEHGDKAIQALHRMEELIDDALTLAREGKDIGEVRPLALDALASRAWDTVSTPAATLEIDADGDAVIEGDDSRVVELFENLFRNAIEHGLADAADGESPAEPVLTVRVETLENGFAIEDDGPGVPATGRAQLFEPGYTTDPDSTGLGLAIVKRIADAHGWSATVTESVAGGARFEFTTE